jgi:hypothetical protein
MRLICKLSVMLLATLVLQEWLQGGGGVCDEIQFTARAYISELRGLPRNEPHLLESAKALSQREIAIRQSAGASGQ